ncbi:MAG: hypothetical protein K9I29_00290 [Bacteroidales bacterium]|nr:hypothetical protein [Bacteroidales bacterium]MCF8326704.1 hypothetical protein [Bacteroidales bacterium]
MQKSDLNLFFARIRNIHTFVILILVIILMTSVFYTYTFGALTKLQLESSYLLIILIALANLSAVLYSAVIIQRNQKKLDFQATLDKKTTSYRKAYLRQMIIISFFILIDTITFLLTGNKVLFLMAFAVLIFLFSLNPSKEKFIKHTPLSEAEKKLFD